MRTTRGLGWIKSEYAAIGIAGYGIVAVCLFELGVREFTGHPNPAILVGVFALLAAALATPVGASLALLSAFEVRGSSRVRLGVALLVLCVNLAIAVVSIHQLIGP